MSWWRRLFRRRKLESELDAELRNHVELQVRDYVKAGLTHEEARRKAALEFGNLDLAKEECRDAGGIRWAKEFAQDCRYGVRQLLRQPGFACTAILLLTLIIGANTAIFGLVNTLILQDLPVRAPERLVELLSLYPGDPRVNSFPPDYYEYVRDNNTVFSDLIAFSGFGSAQVGRGGLETETVHGQYVVGDFFRALGVSPAIGRLIDASDDQANAAPVAVVSWTYWQNRFDLDPRILGDRILVDGSPATIVGVLPREFFGLQVGFRTDLWLPATMADERPSLGLLGRLAPGVTIEEARAEMNVLDQSRVENWARESDDPLVGEVKIDLEPARAGSATLRDQFANPLLALMALASLLLIVACTNVASMLLARGTARRHEFALRVSLGAGRFRLLRQVLTESLLLSAVGTLFGIVLAYLGAKVLVRILASGRPQVGWPGPVEIRIEPDIQILLFTAGVVLLGGLLSGLAPAWIASRTVPASSLRTGGRTGETRSQRSFGNGLVIAQVAVSLLLLSSAAAFVLHRSNLLNNDLGFQRESVLLVSLDPEPSQRDRLFHLYEELLERLKTIPGVRAATLAAPSPFSGGAASRFVEVEGFDEEPESRRRVLLAWVAPRYFETLGTPLVAGRDFQFEDRGRPRRAIVNESVARYYFGDSDPIGRHLSFEGGAELYEIIAVARDAKYLDLRQPPPRTIYMNAFQEETMFANAIALRTDLGPAAVAGAVRQAVRSVMPSVPIAAVTTLADQVDASIVPERLIATLSATFGTLGTVLAAIGMYGLLAYTVARRTNEIGIRMALGATRRDVLRMVLQGTLGLLLAGLVLGVPIAIWTRRFTSSLIADLSVGSTLPMVFAATLMTTVSLLAVSLPAYRATRVDPLHALRHE